VNVVTNQIEWLYLECRSVYQKQACKSIYGNGPIWPYLRKCMEMEMYGILI